MRTNHLNAWLPPVLLQLYRRCRGASLRFEGNYNSWSEAQAKASGYDVQLILDRVACAVNKVITGEAVCERDSVLFDTPQVPLQMLAGIFHAANTQEGRLNVLDFGGSLGSSYFQCRNFLTGLSVSWHVVEQANFVERGREYFEVPPLKFFYTIEESAKVAKPDVILFSSVLQYLAEPYAILQSADDIGAQYIIIDRTPFANIGNDHLCIQHVPKAIYPASYPSWIFDELGFRKRLMKNFTLLADFDTDDGSYCVAGKDFKYRGMIWKRSCD